MRSGLPRPRLSPGWKSLAVLLLTGCAALGTRISSDVAYQYQPEEIGAVASGQHQLKVDIRQKPFAIDDVTFSNAVVNAMQGSTRGRVVNFSLAPDNPYPRGNYRTVVLFSPPAGTVARQLCKSGPLDTTTPPGPLDLVPSAGEVRVQGALCQGELALSWASGRSSQATTIGSPGFDQLISQMTLALFPSENRKLDEGCPSNVILCN